jgi:CheY-like chemotaxis protein
VHASGTDLAALGLDKSIRLAGDEQKSIEAGMNDHVTKPIDPDQLFAILQKWIKPKEKGRID